MTKSPKALAQHALRFAEESLQTYSSQRSRKDFTQHQLFAILTLKTFFKTDYRSIVQLLTDLREELKLAKIPHCSTLYYAANRLLKKGRQFASCDAHSKPKTIRVYLSLSLDAPFRSHVE